MDGKKVVKIKLDQFRYAKLDDKNDIVKIFTTPHPIELFLESICAGNRPYFIQEADKAVAGMISKQPNGLYCRISTVVEASTQYDMTEAELYDYLIQTNQLDSDNQSAGEWYSVYGIDFEKAKFALGAGCSTYDEVKTWLIEVGYQNAHEFMKEIAYRWEEQK